MYSIGDEVGALKWPCMTGVIVAKGQRCDWIVKWSPVTIAEAKKMHFTSEMFERATSPDGWDHETWSVNIAPASEMPAPPRRGDAVNREEMERAALIASLQNEDFSDVFREE